MPADGLMRGMRVPSNTPQSTHSRHFDRRQVCIKKIYREKESLVEKRKASIVNAKTI